MIKNFGGSNKIYTSWGRDDQILFNECHAKGIEPRLVSLSIWLPYTAFKIASKISALVIVRRKKRKASIGKGGSTRVMWMPTI